MNSGNSHHRLKKLFFTAVLMAGFVFLVAPLVHADLSTGGTGLSIPTGTVQINTDIVQTKTFGEAVLGMVNYFTGFVGFLAVLVFIYAGVSWVISGGDTEAIEKAKKMMTYAALGIIVMTLSYTAVTFITSATKSSCTTDAQCGAGQACVGGSCALKLPCDLTATPPRTCSTAGQICVAGYCENTGRCTGTVGTKGSCDTGFICSATGTCITPQCSPTDPKSCPTGQSCLGGECVLSMCATNADCKTPPNTMCVAGVCQNPNSPGFGIKTLCAKNTDCKTAPFTMCVAGVCQNPNSPGFGTKTLCAANTDCKTAPFTMCVAGVCQNPNSLGFGIASLECDPSAIPPKACKAPGEICVGGTCQSTITPGFGTSAPDCSPSKACTTPGDLCVAGTCQPSSTCNASSDCYQGQVCLGGTCVLSLACPATPCAQGLLCVAGTCQNPVSPGFGTKALACNVTATPPRNCPASLLCIDGTCQNPVSAGFGTKTLVCSATTPCAAGQLCVAGSCQLQGGTATTTQCSLSANCPAGQICSGGVCFLGPKCDASTPCTQGLLCVAGVCQSSTGVGTGGVCLYNADCGAGQVCFYNPATFKRECRAQTTVGCSPVCSSDQWCVQDTSVSSANFGKYSCVAPLTNLKSVECTSNAQCTSDATKPVCLNFACSAKVPTGGQGQPECFTYNDCVAKNKTSNGEVCFNNSCQLPPIPPGGGLECLASFNCPLGKYCAAGTCNTSADVTCQADSDCQAPRACDPLGFCRNPGAAEGSVCTDNTDCPSSFVCNGGSKQCEFQGNGGGTGPNGVGPASTGTPAPGVRNPAVNGAGGTGGGAPGTAGALGAAGANGANGTSGTNGTTENPIGQTGDQPVIGTPAQAASEDNLTKIDSLLGDVTKDLETVGTELEALPDQPKADIKAALATQGAKLDDKIAALQTLLDKTTDPAVIAVLEKLIDGLEKLKELRAELDDLKTNMPESAKTIQAWQDASDALNALTDDPASNLKLRRFETKYRDLKDLIHAFPVVQAKIRAFPSEGNVPFTVTLDGLDSVDPTGGTISNYNWTYLDNSGSEVSLGSQPVVVQEFTQANTYSVRLQVSTSQKDKDGYKTASDGVSTLRIKANPPTSQVRFMINGVDVSDVYHVTLQEAMAGLSFDPGASTPAIGRTLDKFNWTYGDTITELRTSPTTVVHSYGKKGEYFANLEISDNLGTKDKKTVKVFVKSLAADIQISPTSGNVNTLYTFEGIRSRSDDGQIKAYEWQIKDKDGAVVNDSVDRTFDYKFDRPGNYTISLIVTDNTGAKDTSVRVLTVNSRPPVASFSFDIPQNNHPNRVEFNAINSYDPDEGDKVKYSWDFEGDGIFDVVNSPDTVVTHEYKKAGSYRAILQVEDDFGKRDQQEKPVTIASVLSADIILEHRAVRVGDEVTFKVDSPNATSYLWEFADGTTGSSEEKTIKHIYTRKGKFRVVLHFFDADNNENTDTTTVLVGDTDAPLALVNYFVNGLEERVTPDLCGPGKDGAEVTRVNTIVFSGKNSINIDGSERLLSYDWTLPDGLKDSEKEFSHRFDELTTGDQCFKVGLTVRDSISGKLSDEDAVYFKVANQAPQITDLIITTDNSQKELLTPTKVRLKAVNPKDPDGSIKKFRWWYYREGHENEKLGTHSTSVPDTEMVITAEGQPDTVNRYFFVLEVTDNDNAVYNSQERFGEQSYVDVKNGPNLSPVAAFTMDKSTISVGDSITFISQSYDPQGDTLPTDAFRWDFDGDGQFDDLTSGPQVNRQFNTPGTYNPRLKVVYRGLSSSATKTIVVEPTQSLPQAAFTYTIDHNTVSFDASNSRFDKDLKDTTLRYEWDFDIASDANGNGIKDDDVQSTEMKPSFTYPTQDIYRVRLKVKDSLGMEGVVVRDVNLNMSEAEREKGTYRSLQITSPNQPLTSLYLTITPAEIPKNGSADINVSVINADNSPYLGQVFFDVLDGSGDFAPNPVDAKDSKASTVFTGTETGKVRIRVKAANSHFGDIEEEATITVR